ncbi:MAG TPA: Rieske (2Fe-2S) protein [Polyangia bacterium]|nr:Rieske (2Fe-2S) protein [Polyangia bacterium]
MKKSSGCESCEHGRRRWMKLTASSAGLVLLGGGAGCGHPTGSPPTGPVVGGNVSALSVGGLLVMSNVIVARDADGVYAMSAVCTHAGCLLDDSASTISAGLSCPCHGSRFDGAGKVTNGPAGAPLQHYAVAIAADGTITIDGSQPVAADVRTQVPA